MNHFVYEELRVGQEESFSVKVSEEMLDSFCRITGDVNPLHRDSEFAKRHHFPDRVVYGMLTSSFLSTLAGVYLPGERCLIQSVETKFIAPVFIGDVLLVAGRISELNDSVRRIVVKVTITNQHGKKVLRGIMKLGVLQE